MIRSIMTIRELIASIEQKHKSMEGITIHPPASALEIQNFKKKTGFELPADFKEFYSICNGFECSEDDFNMISLTDIMQNEQGYGKNWYYFAEYMLYSDMWS